MTARPSPVDLQDMLLHLLEIADSDEQLSPLGDALRAYFSGAGSLDKCLGLVGKPGKRRISTRFRKHERDRHLRAAWALCVGESDWARSCNLTDEIRRFASIIWPRWRELREPPADSSQLRAHLFWAFKQGLLVPETAPGIHAITKRTAAIRFAGDVENGECENPNGEDYGPINQTHHL